MIKKKLGQHFLKDKNYILKIIRTLKAEKGDGILEIGPGKGSLTIPMLEKGFKVFAIEKDENLKKYLEIPNLRVFFEDALNFPPNLNDFLNENKIKYLVSNLPYNVGTRIYLRYLPFIGSFEQMVLMFQEEVAEKIIAKVGSSNYGGLSVITEVFAEAEKVLRVPPSAFFPEPEVYSAVLSFKGKPVAGIFFDDFYSFLNKCFKHPRKTLYNNLIESFDRNIINVMFEKNNLNFNIRPHQIDCRVFLKIYRDLKGELWSSG